MKTLLLALTITLSSIAGAADFYGDISGKGIMGIQHNNSGIEFSVYDEEFSGIHKFNLEFRTPNVKHVEVGFSVELTKSVRDGFYDYRVIDVEGGFHIISKPYMQIGDELFAIITLDETNSPVLKVGFKLW